MSAGICIMNKNAIALAADSAVTIGQHLAIHDYIKDTYGGEIRQYISALFPWIGKPLLTELVEKICFVYKYLLPTASKPLIYLCFRNIFR